MAFILILCHCVVVLFELCIDNNQIHFFFFFFFCLPPRSLLMACLSEKHIFKLVWPKLGTHVSAGISSLSARAQVNNWLGCGELTDRGFSVAPHPP